MTCACNCLSPFRWASIPQDSIFLSDGAFCRGASSGKTVNQIQTEAMARYEDRNGRSAGTIYGISDKADKQAAQRVNKRSRAPSHNRRKA